jgi:carboxymethylenebutenolidase
MMSSDLKSLLPEVPPQNRREFLVTKLAAGFALAVSPAGAQTITTDTNGLTAGEVNIPVEGGTIPAYRAMPSRGNNFPIVLVVQEIFGVHEYIKDICRRFAKAGYLAVAPEMYARQGDVSKLENIQQILDTVVSKVPDAQVISDLDAAADWAGQNRGNRQRVAVTGFCWGGRVVWLYAALGKNVKAGVAWYGRLEGEPNAMTPKHPLDYAGALKAPVLGLYGAKDAGIPLASVEKMRAALKVVDSPSEIIVYPNSEHGFHADYRPSYNPADARDGWARMLAWFKRYGV